MISLPLTGLKSIFATFFEFTDTGVLPVSSLGLIFWCMWIIRTAFCDPGVRPDSFAFQVQYSSHTAGQLEEQQHVWWRWSACDSKQHEMTFSALSSSEWQLWCQLSFRQTKLCWVSHRCYLISNSHHGFRIWPLLTVIGKMSRTLSVFRGFSCFCWIGF